MEERVLVTVDKDFGELAVLDGSPHHGIVRLVDIRARLHGVATHEAIARYSAELALGAIVMVMPGRVRIRVREAPRNE